MNIDRIKALSSLASTSSLAGDINGVDGLISGDDNTTDIIINNDASILDNKINNMVNNNNKRITNIHNDNNNNNIDNDNNSNYYYNGNSYSCCEKITKGCMKGIVTHHPGRYLRIETYNYTIKQYWTCCHRKKRAGVGCVPGPHPNPFGLNDPICENFLCTVKLQNDENERKKLRFQKRNIDSNQNINRNNTNNDTINNDENNNKNKTGTISAVTDFIPKESNNLKNSKISRKDSWRNSDGTNSNNNFNNNNNNNNNNNDNIDNSNNNYNNQKIYYNNICYNKNILLNLNNDSYSDTSGNSSSTSTSVYHGNNEMLSISLPITPPLFFSTIDKNNSAPPSAQISPRYKNYKKKVEFDFDKERKKEYLM